MAIAASYSQLACHVMHGLEVYDRAITDRRIQQLICVGILACRTGRFSRSSNTPYTGKQPNNQYTSGAGPDPGQNTNSINSNVANNTNSAAQSGSTSVSGNTGGGGNATGPANEAPVRKAV